MNSKFLTGAGLAFALGGCAFEPALTAKIVDYNRVAEDVGNSLLLMNVLRAKDRKPLYFSHLSGVNPGITSSIGLNSTLPLSPISYTTLSLNPTARLDSSNSGTVGMEAGKDFMRGITTPINMDTFDYFWQRGWPRYILLNLFVQKIEVAYVNDKGEADSTRPVRVYFNSPSISGPAIDDGQVAKACRQNEFVLGQGRAQFQCFQYLLRSLEPVLRLSTRTTITPITPLVRSNEAPLKDWRALVEAAKGGYGLNTTGGFQLVKNSEAKRFCIIDPKEELDPSSHRRSSTFGCEARPPAPRQRARDIRLESQGVVPQKSTRPGPSQKQPVPPVRPTGPAASRALEAHAELDSLCGEKARCMYFFQLRSPESMLYYLGEITRAHLDSGGEFNVLVFDRAYSDGNSLPDPRVCGKGEASDPYFHSLFQVAASDPSNSQASVTYEGRKYHIPGPRCHASMQALALVSQLIALQRDAKELPVTTNVRVIGP